MKSSKKVGSIEILYGFHIRRLASLFVAEFTRSFNGTGMRQIHIAVLSIVKENPEINQKTVAQILGMFPANIVSVITNLCELGCLERRSLNGNRRESALVITPVGKHSLEAGMERIIDGEMSLLNSLSNDERLEFINLVKKILSSNSDKATW